jgi:hypothetical protein
MAQESRYPIKFLYQAYNILEGQGHTAFMRFVNHVDMPTEDVERVLNKYNYNHDEEFRSKIDEMILSIKKKLDNWAGPSQRGDRGFKNTFPRKERAHGTKGDPEQPAPF